MKTKGIDSGSRLAQDIIQFAKTKNMKIRKKRNPPTASTKQVQKQRIVD
ncbi:hypothetical protein [Paenibacillus sp. Dod16]